LPARTGAPGPSPLSWPRPLVGPGSRGNAAAAGPVIALPGPSGMKRARQTGIRMLIKILATPRGHLAEISAEPAGDGGVHERRSASTSEQVVVGQADPAAGAWRLAAQTIWPSLRSCIVSVMANDPFRALAHPIRRAIVERLAGGSVPIGKATEGFGVSKPTISRHVKVLEEAGVVIRRIEGRTHRIGLDLDALAGAVDWLDRQRAIWERMFDVVDEYLEEQEKAK
jgi:DNA-binding transcriptional ArsR family regulator